MHDSIPITPRRKQPVFHLRNLPNRMYSLGNQRQINITRGAPSHCEAITSIHYPMPDRQNEPHQAVSEPIHGGLDSDLVDSDPSRDDQSN